MRIEALADHDRSSFSCGNAALDEWFHRYATQNQRLGNARTFVAIDGNSVVGFVSLSASQLVRAEAPERIAKNSPQYIPGILIGRLAVDSRRQGEGIGTLLLAFALRRALDISEQLGVRIVQVHAIDEDAKKFYQTLAEFEVTPAHPMTLCLTIADLKKSMR